MEQEARESSDPHDFAIDSDVDIFTRVHFNENLEGHHDPHDLTINSDVDF